MEKKGRVIVCFGKGGHEAQALRLVKKLKERDDRLKFFAFTDSENISADIFDKCYLATEVRDKYDAKLMNMINASIKNIKISLYLVRKNNTTGIISCGPGIAVIPALVFRLFGKKVIHIETWSRFTTKSMAGALMYYLSTDFYIQNESLSELYPRAKYCGRL